MKLPNPSRSCLQVFIRVPEAGKVKTRLMKVLPSDTVLELYKRFAVDVLEILVRCRYPIKVFYHPPGGESSMRDWLGSRFTYHPQQGNDLGERMANAFRSAFSDGFHRALLVGTDIPDLPERAIHDAFHGLRTHDSVVGPTADGGYYLIGFNAASYSPQIFEDMTWGAGDVLEITLNRLRRLGNRCRKVLQWHDIDEYEDLSAFERRNTGRKDVAPNTSAYLKTSGLGLNRKGG